MCGAPESELVPIDEVARRLGIKASAIRYYEERGLVRPRRREAGRRWFGDAEIRRLAIIQYWQSSGLLSLDDIADILAGPRGNRRWPTVVRQHIDSLQAQIDRMTTASRGSSSTCSSTIPTKPPTAATTTKPSFGKTAAKMALRCRGARPTR